MYIDSLNLMCDYPFGCLLSVLREDLSLFEDLPGVNTNDDRYRLVRRTFGPTEQKMIPSLSKGLEKGLKINNQGSY